MSKSREEKEAAAQENLAQEQRAAGERQRAAGIAAQERITQVGKPTAEETGRLERYRTKATTPGETLMTQAGPISQAVARRIQERIDQPGMDFDVASDAYAEQIGAPLWRGLKARGIAPRPGAEGGLGVSQYMESALPAMSILRSQQIGKDITRGTEYGREARQEVGIYEELERWLSEAMRGREVGGVQIGAPYGIAGEQAYGAGMVGGAQTEAEYASVRAGRQMAKRAKEEEQIKDAIKMLVGGMAGGAGGGGAGGAAAGASLAGAGGQQQFYTQQDISLNPYRTSQDPYSRALQSRMAGRGY